MTARHVLIVGGGPAGCSAALWARSRGLTASVIEREPSVGGQLHAIHTVPGQLPGIDLGDGHALAAVAARDLARSGATLHTNLCARALEVDERGPIVRASDAVQPRDTAPLRADAVLIACGLDRRRLGIAGEREFEGRGVSLSATRDRAALAGGNVMVVGGGDAAYENAWLLAGSGSRVTLVMRAEPRARRSFRERVAAAKAVNVLTHTHVSALLGDDRLRGARLTTPAGTRDIELTGAVIKVGWAPDTSWCSPPLKTDDEGFIRIDDRGRTSAASVWAAGDVTRPPLFAISVAYAAAAVAMVDIAHGLLDE